MIIKVLGAHNCETQGTRLTSFLIDNVLAIDAGSLTSSLSLSEQLKIEALLVTHQHYDHIRDIPSLAMNFNLHKKTIHIYSSQAVHEILAECLLNGRVYPKFMSEPEENPTINFTTVDAYQTFDIGCYSVLTAQSNHSVLTLGYQITSEGGKSVFYTGDTGVGLDYWQHLSPDLLITEVIASNRYEGFAREKGHLTPSLLEQELKAFRETNNYLPRVTLVHIYPDLEEEIRSEIDRVSRFLNHPIDLAYEGMQIEV